MIRVTLLVAVCALLFAASAHSHGDHDRTHECACEAEELGFTINCTDTAFITAAFQFLVDNDCQDDCETKPGCQGNYTVVVAHHDHCLHDQIPRAVEDGLHDFEGFCEDCLITRAYEEGLPDCEQPTCSSAAAANAAAAYLENDANGCAANCSLNACGENFRVIRSFHDLCDEDDVTRDVEDAVHDFEDACEDFGCNTAEPGSGVPECKSAGFAAAASFGLVALLALAAVLAA